MHLLPSPSERVFAFFPEGKGAGKALPTSPLRGEVAAEPRVRGSDDQAAARPAAANRARSLRRSETEAEHKLWSMLRGRRLSGHKFVRQLPIGPYFADFACREAALMIEVDGSQHAESSHDRVRDQFIVEQGYSVLRFWNNQVLAEPDNVASSILAALSLHPSPGERYAPATLSPEGRAEKGVSAATTRQRSRHLTADLPRLLKD